MKEVGEDLIFTEEEEIYKDSWCALADWIISNIKYNKNVSADSKLVEYGLVER